MLLPRSMVFAQIPAEVFGGEKKATFDLMFFRYFKHSSGRNTRLLFFNRNRVSIDYKMNRSTFLPQFGFTEAISWNHEKAKGFAPVIVAQVFSSGFFPKAGIQFAYLRKDLTLFSWLVCEVAKEPGFDLFFLGRYTPALTEKLSLFFQLELVNAFPTAIMKSYSFTQRFRLGLKIREFQFGAGADLSQTGRGFFITTTNNGGFLRYEF